MYTYFYHHQLQRYMIAFGSFFNNIQISREDVTGAEVQRMVVPLEYGPKERWLARITQDPDLLKGVGVVVPRMAFELTSINGDWARHVNSMNTLDYPTQEQAKLARMYAPVPYTLSFNLDILTKIQSDALQIVEQILPYFTPDLSFRLQPVPELGFADQIPLTLSGINQVDNYEGDFEHRRAIIWSLTFSMKVNFYGPVKTQSRIQEVIVNVYNSPLLNITLPPEVFATEDGALFELETNTGHLLDESSPEPQQPTAVIDVKALPNQDPVPGNALSITTITEDLDHE